VNAAQPRNWKACTTFITACNRRRTGSRFRWCIRRKGSHSYLHVPLEKVAAVVLTNSPIAIARSSARRRFAPHCRPHFGLLAAEVKSGRVPPSLLPLQSGVGNIANAVLHGLKEGKFENLTSFTEVIQDGMIELLRCGKLTCASATAFSLSPEMGAQFNSQIREFRDRIVLRPQEISNHAELIRRLGVIG